MTCSTSRTSVTGFGTVQFGIRPTDHVFLEARDARLTFETINIAGTGLVVYPFDPATKVQNPLIHFSVWRCRFEAQRMFRKHPLYIECDETSTFRIPYHHVAEFIDVTTGEPLIGGRGRVTEFAAFERLKDLPDEPLSFNEYIDPYVDNNCSIFLPAGVVHVWEPILIQDNDIIVVGEGLEHTTLVIHAPIQFTNASFAMFRDRKCVQRFLPLHIWRCSESARF